MTYANQVSKKSRTSVKADKPIPGRENEMTKNLAGGYVFKADDWQVLRRWLLTGSMGNSFYQSADDMTSQNLQVLEALIEVDPVKVGAEILYAMNKGVNVHTPILALVYLSLGNSPKAKQEFRTVFPEVIRTASHLYEFISYTKHLRGFGSTIHKAVGSWFEKKDTDGLEYQFLKYQNRSGFTGRDILRIFKPKTTDEVRNALFNWIAGGSKKNPLGEVPEALKRIKAYEALKAGKLSKEDILRTIRELRFTWEMIPGSTTLDKDVWSALFETMPVGATIRSLGNLTDKGVLGVRNTQYLDMLEERFSRENLQRAYTHPIALAGALRVYQAGGSLGKSKLTWSPIPRVCDILEYAISNSFDFVEPTGKNLFYAIDVSGSMNLAGAQTPMGLKPYEIAGILALASVKTEKNYFVGGFSRNFVQIPMTKKTSFAETMRWQSGIWPREFGGTDASSAYRYATQQRIFADTFVFITDSENWAGTQPSIALKEYRNRVNKDVKAIYITIVPYGSGGTLTDPKDPLSFDVAGFTSETVKIINMITKGEI